MRHCVARDTAIDIPTADDRADEDFPNPSANDAPVRAAPGGVGAVRRPPRLRRGISHRRAGTTALALALTAAVGAASPTAFSPRAEILAATRMESDTARAEWGSGAADGAVELAAPGAEATAPAPATPPEPPPAEPAPAPPSVEKPIVAPPVFSDRPARVARAPRALTTPAGPKEGGVWAVVIGIDDYPGSDADLRAAAADARDVDAALAAYGVPAARRILMLDHNASAANIRGSLAWLTRNASPDATVVFFYSGHVRHVGGDMDNDGEAVDEAMVGADGNHVLDGEMADIFRGLEARSAWIGIAACYGGGFDDAIAAGRLLTAAAAEGDLAYENSALGHSYLVEYMVRRAMLQAKAPGSVQEAFAWARNQIARDYPNRQPVIIDRAKGPVVLGVRGGPPAPQPQNTQPAPGQPQPQPQPQNPPPEPAPAPEAPPAPPGEPPPGACAEVLGVSVCSNSRALVAVTAAWRRAV